MLHRLGVPVASGCHQGLALYSCLPFTGTPKSLILGHENSPYLQAEAAHWSFMALARTHISEELRKLMSLLPFLPNSALMVIKKNKNVSILLDFRLTAWPGISCQVVSGKLLNQYPHSISSRKGKGRGKKIIIMLLPNCLSFLQL